MSDDLAALHRLDRALDELAGSPGGTPTQELDAPTAAMNGTPTVELNGHRPTRPKARQPEEPGEERDGPRAVDALVATAAGLRAAVPPPSPEAGARGRDAFLASTDAFIGSQQRGRWRKLLLRATALAAALLLVGIPGALARQACPAARCSRCGRPPRTPAWR